MFYLYGGTNGRYSYLRTDSLVTLGDHRDRDHLAEGVRKLDQRDRVVTIIFLAQHNACFDLFSSIRRTYFSL